MVNKEENNNNEWINIHADFVDIDLIKGWTNRGFDYDVVTKWKEYLGSYFDPYEYEFIDWLGDKCSKGEVILNQANIKQLKEEYEEEIATCYDNQQEEEWKVNEQYPLGEKIISHFFQALPQFLNEEEKVTNFFKTYGEVIFNDYKK